MNGIPSHPELLFVGRHIWPDPPSDNRVDLPVLLRLQKRLGAVITVVCCGAGGTTQRYRTGDLRIVQVPVRLGRVGFVSAALGEAKALSSQRRAAKVLVASEPWGGLVGLIEQRLRGVPYLMHLQGDLLRPGQEYGSWPRRVLLRALTSCVTYPADTIRCLNPDIASQAKRLHPRGSVVVLGSRVDTGLFSFRPPRSHIERPSVVCVGSLISRKNQAVLVAGMAMAANSLGGLSLTFVGDGPAEDSLRRAAKLGNGLKTAFLGHVPNDELPSLLGQHDFFALPSLSEGQPRAALEAMAVGLPVMLSDIPAHRSLLGPNGPGLLVDPGDPQAWSDAVIDLCQRPEAATHLANDGRGLVLRNHDFETQLDAYAELLMDCAARRARP